MDTRGEMVIKPVYDYAVDFSEGLAVVGVADGEGRLAYQVVNKQGNVQFYITLQNCRIHERFACGCLMFKNLEQNYCGALDMFVCTCQHVCRKSCRSVMMRRYSGRNRESG